MRQYSLEIAKNGLPTLSVTDETGRRVFLHSTVSPEKESSSFIRNLPDERFDTLVIFGLGLAYHLSGAFTEKKHYKNIIIIEALADISKEISQSLKIEIADAVILEGLDHLSLEKALSENIDLEKSRGISAVEHPASIRAFPSYYSGAKKILKSVIDAKTGEAATKSHFGPLFFKNALKKIAIANKLVPVNDLFDKFTGLPALIISSAPSAEAVFPFLEDLSKKSFIIAADSAASMLAKKRVIPDFIMSIDPQPLIEEHLSGIDLSKSRTIISITGHNPDTTFLKRYLSLNSHPLSQIIEDHYPGSIGSVNSATGNVTGDALLFGIRAGFSPLIIVGADFSFPGHKIYARGTAYQKRYSEFFNNRFSTAETMNFNYIMKSSGKSSVQKNTDGKKMFSRKNMISYREKIGSMKELIERKNTGEIYHFCPNGIPLENMKTLDDLSEVISIISGSVLNKERLFESIEKDHSLSKFFSFLKLALTDESIFYHVASCSSAEKKDGKLRAFFTRV